MRKISGQVLSTKPVSLARAAKLITRFAAVDNGSSPAIALYLERTAEAFNHLVQFHKKSSLNADAGGDEPDRERVQKLQSDWLGENPGEEMERDSGNGGDEDGNDFVGIAEANPMVEKDKALSNEEEENSKEKKKKKNKNRKRKGDLVDTEEKKSSKKRKIEHPDS